MKKLLGIVVLVLLWCSNNANAGLEEPGNINIHNDCIKGFEEARAEARAYYLKKQNKKLQTVVYGSCNFNGRYRWQWNWEKSTNLKELHKKSYEQCSKHSKKISNGECFLYSVNDEVVWKFDHQNYVFKESLYTDCDILTKKDPTTFQTLTYVEEKSLLSYDRRGGLRWANHFIFKAKFKKGNDITIQVNSEFKTKDKAEKKALKYGTMIGQLPYFLKENIFILTIHKGNKPWGCCSNSSGGNEITIHTGDSGAKGRCGEETMQHEAGHALGGESSFSSWTIAQEADNKFISKYAKEFPVREDVAETINWWIAVRCKPDKISKTNYKKILEAIPNRLKYLDEQNYDTYPLVCK